SPAHAKLPPKPQHGIEFWASPHAQQPPEVIDPQADNVSNAKHRIQHALPFSNRNPVRPGSCGVMNLRIERERVGAGDPTWRSESLNPRMPACSARLS